ncbi:MAG: succinate dehydrogenase assembly factor 2 [Pseudomonadota bacterium]
MENQDLDLKRKQLMHRAKYRGFREADLYIGGFAAAHVPQMTPAELTEFEELLGISDHDLYGWIIGTSQPPANVSGPVFEQLQAFNVAEITAPRRG